MTADVGRDGDGGARAHARLGLGMLAVYSSGQFVDGMVATGLARFLPIYLTGVLGLSGTLAGLTGLISLTVDAFSDPLIGSLSDNSNSRHGRRHPFMLGGTIPVALGMGLLFSLPTGLPSLPLFIIVTALLVLLRFGHSAFNLPYVALGAELSDDYRERTVIVAARNLMNVVAATACIVLGLSVFLSGPNGQSRHDSYAPMGWTFAALAAAGALVCVLGTGRLRDRLHKAAPAQGSIISRLYRDVVEVFRNKSFRTLFFSCVAIFSGLGAVVFLQPFVVLFFWRLPAGVVPLIYLGPTLGAIPGIAISIVLARFFEKKTITAVGIAAFAALQILPVSLRLLGLFPLEGMPLYVTLVSVELTVGVALALATVGFQSMMADAADEHEHLFGTRREGLFFAGLNFGLKAAAGVGGLVGGVALDLIHLPASSIAKGAAGARLPTEVTTHLALIYGPGGAAFTVIAGLIFVTYRLDSKRHREILLELKTRRSELKS
jgi:GPH family glycoside/pentoside/hexuronide:cation symporter